MPTQEFAEGLPISRAEVRTTPARPTDWLQELTNAAAEQPQNGAYLSILAIGDQGSGKTLFSGSAPKPVFLDFDKGLMTLKVRNMEHKSIPFPGRTQMFKNLSTIFRDARDRTGPFAPTGPFGDRQSIILDGITKLAETLLYETMVEDRHDPVNDKPERDHWGFVTARLKNLIAVWQDIPMHRVITALTRLDRDEASGTVFGEPNILGSYRGEVGRDFDEVYYFLPREIRQENGREVVYEVHTRNTGFFKAKSRLGLPPVLRDLKFDQLINYRDTQDVGALSISERPTRRANV